MDDLKPIKSAIAKAGMDRNPQDIIAAHQRWEMISRPWRYIMTAFRQLALKRGEVLWDEFVELHKRKEEDVDLVPNVVGWIIYTGLSVLLGIGLKSAIGGSKDSWGVAALIVIIFVVSIVGSSQSAGTITSFKDGAWKVEWSSRARFLHCRRFLYFPIMPFVRIYDAFVFRWYRRHKKGALPNPFPRSQIVMAHYQKGLAIVREQFLGKDARIPRDVALLQEEVNALAVDKVRAQMQLQQAQGEQDHNWIVDVQEVLKAIQLRQAPLQERLMHAQKLLAQVEAFFAEFTDKVEGVSRRMATRDLAERVERGDARRVELMARVDSTMSSYVEELRQQLFRLHAILADAALPANPTDGDIREYLARVDKAGEAVQHLRQHAPSEDQIH